MTEFEDKNAEILRSHRDEPRRFLREFGKIHARLERADFFEKSGFTTDIPEFSEHRDQREGFIPQELRKMKSVRWIEESQPLCGDQLFFYYQGTLNANRHDSAFDAWFGGRFCSLCKVSGSLLMACLEKINWEIAPARELISDVLKRFYDAPEALSKGEPEYKHLCALEIELLMSLTAYKSRIGCLALSWKAAEKALARLSQPKPLWFLEHDYKNSVTSFCRTRIAPSPTGHLHLGHALHLCFVTAVAKSCSDAQITMRIEDHDLSRCRPEYEKSIIADLEWFFGDIKTTKRNSLMRLDSWQRQSDRQGRYQQILESLIKQNLIYACRCSRKDISRELSTDRQQQSHIEHRYHGACQDKQIPLDHPEACLRLKLPQKSVFFYDLRHGPLIQVPASQCGDMMVRDRSRQWTYQFAVSVDDMDQGINLIVRGDDLVQSVGRQILTRKILGDEKPVWTYHHPLLYDDATGAKLSKRTFAASWASLRRESMSADELRGLCLYKAGIIPQKEPIGLEKLTELIGYKL